MGLLPMITLQVKQLPPDDWGRPCLKNIKTGAIYVDIELGRDVAKFDHNGINPWGSYVAYNIPGAWHTVSSDGEPDCPLRQNINFEIVK